MKLDPNAPAFPYDISYYDNETGALTDGKHIPGLTIRAYFAAMAMQGILSCGVRESTLDQDIARGAVLMADLTLKALNEDKP